MVLTSQRETGETFEVVAEDLAPWVTVSPMSGALPAGGQVTLRVTVRPAPLDAGTLTATVPVEVDAATRLRLRLRVETDGGVEGTHDLSPVGPNPTRGATRFTLAVSEPQRVVVALYDRLGRRVRAVASQLDADTRQSFTLDTADLASGLYVIRVEGETFGESRTLTVVR